MSDERLRRHLPLLQALLTHHFQHLTGSWRRHGEGNDAVGAVLASIGRTVEVSPVVGNEVAGLVASVQAVTDSDRTALGLLSERLALGFGEELLVAAIWWCELDAELRSVFGVLHDDGRKRHPSTGLLNLVCRPFDIDVPLQPDGLVDAGVIVVDGPLDEPALTPATRQLLDGRLGADGYGAQPVLPERLERLVEPLTALASTARSPIVLRGVTGSGRRLLAAAVARRLGRRPLEAEAVDSRLCLLARMAVGLPLVNSPLTSGEPLHWPPEYGPLFLLAQPEDDPVGAIVVEVPLPDRGERRELWASAAAALDLDLAAGSPADTGPDAGSDSHYEFDWTDVHLDHLAEQFAFTERDVDAAARRARLQQDLGSEAPAFHLLWRAAQQQPDLDLQRVATRIDPVFRFDDLILPDDVTAKLEQLVAHQRHRTQVFERWGFASRMPRGRGVAALLAGPPGTGKTTAAEAIANELSSELFRIDLSRVMSKYIGETEKNLAIAFRQAERSGAILLFDEADALFGKRTDVRDAHDRYANLEVSYLLQRVESFTGLVLLSTNKIGNIDEAFQRRLRFVVRFDAPDAAERHRLWRRSIPDDALLADIDWDRLARHELTGGHIQTAALSAAFLAVADGGVITEQHLHKAVANEFEKLNRAVPPIPDLEAVS